MPLLDLVQTILETGQLPMSLERQFHALLRSQKFNETELAAIDQLLKALCDGQIQPIAG